jgi:uncharacterized protein
MLPSRLSRLPSVALPGPPGEYVRVATGWRARLLGLALLPRPPGGVALLLPRTRSIHTAGMRFALDLHWLDAAGRPLRVDRGVRPWRMRGCRRARMVLETPSSCPR